MKFERGMHPDDRFFLEVNRQLAAIRAGLPRPRFKPGRMGHPRIDSACVCGWCYRPYSSPRSTPGSFCRECEPTAKAHMQELAKRTRACGGLVDFPRDEFLQFRVRALAPGWPISPGREDMIAFARIRSNGQSRSAPEGHRPPYRGRCAICNLKFRRNTGQGSRHPSVDHIWGLSVGGFHAEINCRIVCRGCNARRRPVSLDVPSDQAREIVAWLRGHPAATPTQLSRGDEWLEALREHEVTT